MDSAVQARVRTHLDAQVQEALDGPIDRVDEHFHRHGRVGRRQQRQKQRENVFGIGASGDVSKRFFGELIQELPLHTLEVGNAAVVCERPPLESAEERLGRRLVVSDGRERMETHT